LNLDVHSFGTGGVAVCRGACGVQGPGVPARRADGLLGDPVR
jgi:hypothetical protein